MPPTPDSAQVHAFLEWLRSEGHAKVGPREHVLVQRVLLAPPADLPRAIAALLGTSKEHTRDILGYWKLFFAHETDVAPVVVEGPAAGPLNDAPPSGTTSPARRWLYGGLALALGLVGLAFGVSWLVEIDDVEPPQDTAADTGRPPPRPDTGAPPPTPTARLELVEPAGLVVEASTRVVPGEPGERAVVMAVSGVLTVAGALLFAMVAGARRHRKELDRKAEIERKRLTSGMHYLPALHVVEPVVPFPPDVMGAVARELARVAHALDGAAWDVPRTVDASSREAGRLEPRYRPRRDGVPLLVLVDREEGDHPFLHVYEALLDHWRRDGLAFERWAFTEWLDRLHREDGHRSTVAELARRRPDAVVLVFTRLRLPFREGGRTSWVTQLSRWPGVVLLDPDPRPHRRRIYDGALPDDGPPHLPLTEGGLFAAARWLKEGGEPRAEWPEWQPPSARPDLHRPLSEWAAIATLVPRPRWAHLDDLRRTFVAPALPHWSDVILLLEFLGLGDDDYGEGLDTDRGCVAHLEALRAQAPDWALQRRVWARLKAQLAARAEELKHEGHGFAAHVARLKIAMHEAQLGERDVRELLETFGGTAVQPELKQLVNEECGLSVSCFDAEVQRDVEAHLSGRAASTGGLRMAGAGTVLVVVLVALGLFGTSVARWSSQTVEVPVGGRAVPATWRVVVAEPDEPAAAADTAPVAAEAALAELGSQRMPFVRLPAGTFTMGSPEGVGDDDEHPSRRVAVPAFEVAVTEVTQAQWRAVMSTVEGAEAGPSDCDFGCGDDNPVQNVSWLDAIDFLNALSDREGLERCYVRQGEDVTWRRDCTGYRLPTEAEWEYAARAGTTTRWSWGDDEARAGEHAWYDGNAGVELHPVGAKRPNPWGLSDVHGNVWEWVWDGYEGDAYRRVPSSDETVVWSDTIVNPNDTPLRVLRGGSFGSTPDGLRSADRDVYWPGVGRGAFGFRCVRAPQLR